MIDAEYFCAYCGEANGTTVDPSAGRRQSYVEDCQTCCRPNVLHITVGDGEASIDAVGESGASM